MTEKARIVASVKPIARVAASPAPPQSTSSHFTKQITSQRIADDIAAFHRAGGAIEKLGVTQVVFKKKEEKPSPVAARKKV